MQNSSEMFEDAVKELRTRLINVLSSYAHDPKGRKLCELLEKQLDCISLCFDLIEAEGDSHLEISGADFDAITEKYVPLARSFAKLPDDGMNSTYKMSLISEWYYILKRHASDETYRP